MQTRGAVVQRAEHDRNIGLRMMVTEDDGSRCSLSGGAGRWSSGLSMTGLFSNFNYNYNDDWDAITPSTLWCPRRPGRGGGGGGGKSEDYNSKDEDDSKDENSTVD